MSDQTQQFPTATVELLGQSKEFVEDTANEELSTECCPVKSPLLSPAESLRQQAVQIEERDAFIRRARELLPRIENALAECGRQP